MVIVLYLPPTDSPHYSDRHLQRVSVIEVCVLNLFERFDNHNVIMVQDLNERTGNEHPDENCLPSNVTKM